MASAKLHPEAGREFEKSIAWYARRSPESARRFRDAVQDAVELVVENPDRWERFGRRHRRYVMNDFPFCLFYLRVGEVVGIMAIAHTSRRPGYWRRRRAEDIR